MQSVPPQIKSPAQAGFDLKRRRDEADGVSGFRRKRSVLYHFDDGQAKKSARGMPWHQEPMKDVTNCDKLRGAVSRH